MATFKIPVLKAGKGVMVDVDDSVFTDETIYHLIQEGLKATLNSRMAKVGAVTKLEGTELAEANAKALSIANENLTALAAGEFKFAGTKAKGAEKRDVLNEAMRVAREHVRNMLKAAGYTISHFPPKDITAAAKQLIETDETFIAKAKETLAVRAAEPVAGIDLTALGLKPDPAKVAKAEAAKETRKQNLSAAQAGKVKARTTKSKPKASVGEVLAGSAQGPGNAAHVATKH